MSVEESSILWQREDLLALVSQSLDVGSLLNWRNASRVTYRVVAEELRSTLKDLLHPFIPCSAEFLQVLTDCQALIGGEVALAFFLRDPTFPISHVEIFTSDTGFHTLIDFFSLSPSICHAVSLEDITSPSPIYITQREVARYATFRTADRGAIFVYESITMSACSPISRTWNTGLMNYVTAHSFGCAYPPLTSARRALVSDMTLDNIMSHEVWTLSQMVSHGFSFAVDPSRWPSYQDHPPRALMAGVFPCRRPLFICPDQGRYFGDTGSLVDFFDPVTHGAAFTQDRGLAPYGHMATWRLWSTRACNAGCALHDPLLEAGVVSILSILVDDPLTAAFPPDPIGPDHPPAITTLSVRLPGRRRAATV
ncbi:hypothetical protein C8Q76DRAFT_797903 [Earliella scabrosa]|nr:hypothetical protein C8Q76DRAFT_797903 [Earliella scabrosa]